MSLHFFDAEKAQRTLRPHKRISILLKTHRLVNRLANLHYTRLNYANAFLTAGATLLPNISIDFIISA
jgi:hypothetical protein